LTRYSTGGLTLLEESGLIQNKNCIFVGQCPQRARFLGAIYPKAQVMQRVTDFLARDDQV
jgi:hypothetical protein